MATTDKPSPVRLSGALGKKAAAPDSLLLSGSRFPEELLNLWSIAMSEDVQPLADAVRDGDLKYLQRAFVNKPHVLSTETGKALFGLAVSTGRREVVSFLADVLDVNTALNDAGWTALHIAAFSSLRGVAEELLSLGADPSQLTRSGMTPGEVARRYGAGKDVLELLRTYRAFKRPTLPYIVGGGFLEHVESPEEKEHRRVWNDIRAKAEKEQEELRAKQEKSRVMPGNELKWQVIDSRSESPFKPIGDQRDVTSSSWPPRLDNYSPATEDLSTTCGTDSRMSGTGKSIWTASRPGSVLQR